MFTLTAVTALIPLLASRTRAISQPGEANQKEKSHETDQQSNLHGVPHLFPGDSIWWETVYIPGGWTGEVINHSSFQSFVSLCVSVD